MNRPSGQMPAARPTGQIPALTAAQLDELPFSPAPIQDMLRLFLKAVRAHQMYLHNNPVYRASVDAVRAAFQPIWQQTDALSLAFSESEVRWEGAPVLAEASRSADSLAWTFFKDGIREIALAPGFETEELERMFDILARARHASPDEDDLLTMLWEADFTNLRYRYVDLGAEATTPLEPSDENAKPPEPGTVRAAAQEQADRPSVVNMQDFDSTLYFLDEQELNYLRLEIDREYSSDLRSNVVSILLDIWEAQPSQAIRDEVSGLIDSMLLSMLAAGDLVGVAYLLAETNAATAQGVDVTLPQRARLEGVAAQLSAAEPLGQLLLALDESADRPMPEELGAVFLKLKPDALGTTLSWIPRLRSAPVRALVEDAANKLAGAHPEQLIALVQSSDPIVSGEAVRRSAAMKLVAAVPSIVKLLAGPSAAGRLAIVNALTEIGSVAALQGIERAIDDADREVRLAAVKTLSARTHRAALTRIEHKVKDKAMRDADLTERTAFFEAYGALCGDGGVPFLDGLLNGKSLFGQREDAGLRACAAIALGRIGTRKAKESLQKSADEKDVVVRNAVTRALRGGT